MTQPQDELLEIADRQRELADRCDAPEIQQPITALENAAKVAEKAASRSWLGYHALVYYEDLQSPPAGAHFSSEWGFKQLHSISTTTGNWREYTPDAVKAMIADLAGKPNLEPAETLEAQIKPQFEADHSAVLSVLIAEISHSPDSYLESLNQELGTLKFHSKYDVIENLRPKGQIISRDSLALTQGFRAPPHAQVLADVFVLQQPRILCNKLSILSRKAASHIARMAKRHRKLELIGTNVFIGHGRSPLWRDLKDFVRERLKLPWDEFNRVPIAGFTNIARLSDMLDSAAVAFLIMTGEDETTDGALHARMNVVHEAGLFQGRLGFSRAIILLEGGCEEFSNIHGLGQIRFPKGNIKAVFEDVRQLLEREKILATD
jgi:predicted nucleotide-binding protein